MVERGLTMRTFIALELGEALTSKLDVVLQRFGRSASSSRWVSADSLHLTLAFLGEVPDVVVPQVDEAIARVAARHPPHLLRVNGSGTFGPLESPKVLWVGVSGALESLGILQRALVREIATLEVAPDHEIFSPHITLARARSPRGDASLGRTAEALRSTDFGELAVTEISLLASHSDQDGMSYSALVKHALTGLEVRR